MKRLFVKRVFTSSNYNMKPKSPYSVYCVSVEQWLPIEKHLLHNTIDMITSANGFPVLSTLNYVCVCEPVIVTVHVSLMCDIIYVCHVTRYK